MNNEQIDEILAFEDLIAAQICAVESRSPFPPEPANLHERLAIRRTCIRPLAEEVKRLRAALEKIEGAILTNSVEWRSISEALKIAREALGK